MISATSLKKTWAGVLAAVFIFGFGFAWTGFCDDNAPYMTGLPEFTPQELQWQNKHQLRVKKVKLNPLGLSRVNEARIAKGLNILTRDDAGVVSFGEELEAAVGATPDTAEEPSQPGLPAAVDNSTLKYFPPIRSQGSFGSCGVYSGTYYAMTYMYALLHDLDAKSGGDEFCFSPKWTYNMVNGGDYNNGSWYYWAYEIGQYNGCATFAEFPYVGSTTDPANYREWSMDPTVWRNAIDRRVDKYGYVDGTNTNTGIEQVKQMLVNGYILNIPTYISSWQWKKIGDDPSTAADDPYVGKNCVFWVNGTSGYHGMTVVGYNDDVWVDINGNGAVDAGEKGAFRIANSWGTGWGESGYCWMAYDALKNPSGVSGGPSAGRITGWSPSRAHWVTARASYQPTMVAEFTLNHLKRNQLRMSLGISDPSRSTPSTTWTSMMINGSRYNSGPYAFDGSTTAVDGTFFLDFTDIAPAGTAAEYHYYVGMYDSSSGDAAELSSYTLIDLVNGGTETVCFDVPKFADGSQTYAYVGYYYDDDNIRPVAAATAYPVSGQAPLDVAFDGTGSSDADGVIASWNWNFGDGAGGSGDIVTHTYDTAGTYTATLTVTDNMGGTDSDSVMISVSPPPPKDMWIAGIDMSLSVKGVNRAAGALVSIINEDGSPVANATVSGQWSGLTSGTVSGTTGSGGTVMLTSANSKSDGVFTFTVTNVSASNHAYNSSFNVETSDSVSTTSSTNQKPVANAGPDQTANVGDIINFDGSGSYDPDGSIASYQWTFGDGGTGTGATTTHTYTSAGTFTVTLTVTDDKGATDSDTAIVTVTDGTVKTMYVYDITITPAYMGKNAQATARVTIRDVNGNPVSNAAVNGAWSGLFNGSVSGVTGADGTVSFVSSRTKSSGSVTFTVTKVSADGYSYDDSLNAETADTIHL
jgi:PKD repeat protein